jgi:hypothetical protein
MSVRVLAVLLLVVSTDASAQGRPALTEARAARRGPAALLREAWALRAVRWQVRSARRSGGRAVVVFDLDNTLFDPTARATRILRWIGRKHDVKALRGFTYNGENAADLYRLVGSEVKDPARLKLLGARFAKMYDRLGASGTLDRLAPGAVAYVNALRRAGATIVYLTGRSAAERRRTLQTLKRAGLPTAGAELIMRPSSIRDVQAFKRGELPRLSALGRVVASFDDDPANCALFKRQMPGARVFQVRMHRRPGEALPAGVSRVRDFSMGAGGLRSLARAAGL